MFGAMLCGSIIGSASGFCTNLYKQWRTNLDNSASVVDLIIGRYASKHSVIIPDAEDFNEIRRNGIIELTRLYQNYQDEINAHGVGVYPNKGRFEEIEDEIIAFYDTFEEEIDEYFENLKKFDNLFDMWSSLEPDVQEHIWNSFAAKGSE